MNTVTIKMKESESWWGGSCDYGTSQPYTKESSFSADFRAKVDNQTMPMYLSNKGRYIWSDYPFAITFEDGNITVEGKDIQLVEAGYCLRDAYLDAMNNHFKFEGKVLPEIFFKTAQYNTWMEHTYFQSQEKVLEYAHKAVDNGFVPGVLMIDEGWAKGYGEWDFDRAKFPDPKAMIDDLHGLGFKIMLWVCPFVSSAGRSFCMAVGRGVNMDDEGAKTRLLRTKSGQPAVVSWWNGYTCILDLSNPVDEKFMDDQLQYLMKEYGVDGFKFDGGSVDSYSQKCLLNGEYADGHDPYALNIAWNEFAKKYKFHECKNTWLGGGSSTIQRLQDRDHDWGVNGLASLIPNTVLTSLLGHPFICPDMIGGGSWIYNEIPGFKVDEELFIRMAQVSALCPMMQFSWAPWRVLSKEAMESVKDAAAIHAKYKDYIWEQVNNSLVTGEPIIRCMEYEFPNQGFDTDLSQFMLGSDILVAPVLVKGNVTKNVKFPIGKWQDKNGNVYDGGKSVVIGSPIDTLLYFKRVL